MAIPRELKPVIAMIVHELARECEDDDHSGFMIIRGISSDRWVEIESLNRYRTYLGAGTGEILAHMLRLSHDLG